MVDNFSKAFQKTIPDLNDINFGIVLISAYFLLEFGSFQGLYPVINATQIPFIISVSSVLYAVYLTLTGKINFNSKTTRYFGYFILFIIFYSFFATKQAETKNETIKVFILYFANYLIIINSVKKETQFIFLLDVWLFSVLFSCYHASMQGGLIWGNRWLKDENHISLVAATALPFSFMLFLVCKAKAKKFFYGVCLFGYAIANVIAHSRGGALSMALGIFLCVAVMKHKIRNFIIIIALVIVGLSYAPPVFFEEMGTLQQGTQEETADDRIYLWGIAMKMFADHPVLGVGPINYPFYFYSYEKGMRYKSRFRVAHSTPLQFIAETGLVGIFFFVLLQVGLFENWRKFSSNAKLLNGSNLYADKYSSLLLLTHACFIAQIAFHFGGLFLTLLPYPFYWCLVAFSEAWKNICSAKLFENNEF